MAISQSTTQRPTTMARQLCRAAKATGYTQSSTIHDVIMIAKPGDRPRHVANVWRAQHARCRWEYEYSSTFEGQRHADKQARQLRLQAHADEAVTQLCTATFKDSDMIVTCLTRLCTTVDYASLTVDWDNIYMILSGLGFREDDRLGDAANMNRRSEVRWMAGQVMTAIVQGPKSLICTRWLLKVSASIQE